MIVHENQLEYHKDLTLTLDNLAAKSRPAILWIDNVIKPVFIMIMYIRAEREGDWPLHLEAVNCILPYFFGAGYVNYAHEELYNLRAMEALPPEVLPCFMKGEHIMHH